jgi:hypothetical protein
MSKICHKCGVVKDLTEFYKDKHSKDGHTNRCKKCAIQYKIDHQEYLSKKYLEDNLKGRSMTVADMAQHINYDPETGSITGIKKPIKIRLGKDGYYITSILNRNFRLHQLAWFLTYGRWAEHIDHIDGNTQNNKISNLRECNYRENSCNRIEHRTEKLVGAELCPDINKWAMRCTVDGVLTRMGYYDTEREASLQYCKYVLKHGLVRREFLPDIFTDEELEI